MQGTSGETDMENRPMDVGEREEGEGEMYGERVTWKLSIPYIK